METYRNRLDGQAESISERLSEFIAMRAYDQVPDYLKLLEELFKPSDIYIISNPTAKKPMDQRMENTKLKDIQLTKQFDQVLESAFAGKRDDTISFSPIYDEVMLAIGVPIYDEQKQVIGAVLLYSQIENQHKMIRQSEYLILISATLALAISFVIAILFAGKIARPIVHMRKIALQLADGNYTVKTEVVRQDEIGDLANTLDVLAERLQQNEKEREKLEQMRQDFFANISHELRTPITVIRAYIETLLDGLVEKEEKKTQYYQRILVECKGMQRLVGDLLVLSKMQNPDFSFTLEPINVVQVAEELKKSIAHLLQGKQLRLCIKKETENMLILADYDRLRQLFMIFLDNAIKFSKENGTITIEIKEQENQMICITIQDEGVGIAKEELPYIFDKFYQSKLRQNESGSGLGLAIAKQIIEKLNGSITVQSKVAEGTKFEFVFPQYVCYNNSDFGNKGGKEK